MGKEKSENKETIYDNIFTAIMVDGGFYRKRAHTCFGDQTPKERADQLEYYVKRHLHERINGVLHEHTLYKNLLL